MLLSLAEHEPAVRRVSSTSQSAEGTAADINKAHSISASKSPTSWAPRDDASLGLVMYLYAP
jgi:hypothetical protein